MPNSSEPSGRRPSDLALLGIQARMGLDENGFIRGEWGLKIAAAREGQLLFLGSELPQQLVQALRTAFEGVPDEPDLTEAPSAIARCERILDDATGRLGRTSGSSYVIPGDTKFTSAAAMVLSDSDEREAVRQANPGNWFADEWDELVDGKLGPWAMAMINGRVTSVCHTPRAMTNDAAECGVWTDPGFRGQGHAAATTAAWASILAPTGRHLFYSVDTGNRSSQSVAARLDLRLIGATWRLSQPSDSAEDSRHPLSNPT